MGLKREKENDVDNWFYYIKLLQRRGKKTKNENTPNNRVLFLRQTLHTVKMEEENI